MKQLKTSRGMRYVNILAILFLMGLAAYIVLGNRYQLLPNIISPLALLYFLNRRYWIDNENILIQNGYFRKVSFKKVIPFASITKIEVTRNSDGAIKKITIRYQKKGYHSWTTIADTDLAGLFRSLREKVSEKTEIEF